MWTFLPIKCASCSVEEGPKVFYLRDFDKLYTNNFYFWLLRGPTGPVLVDTGFDIAEGRTFMPQLEGEASWGPEARLRSLGVDPASIRHVIITHLHFDHFSSAARLYVNAEFHLQRREYETYLDPPHPWFNAFYTKGILEELGDRLRIVDGDGEITEGLNVLLVGGHTPGLQAVILRGPDGRTALASDLAFQFRNLTEDIPIGLFWNLEEVYKGMERLRKEADLVLPGHDPRLEELYPLEGGAPSGAETTR